MVRGFPLRWLAALGVVWAIVAGAADAPAAVCGPVPTDNAGIFSCFVAPPGTCTITSANIPAGCEVDFGTRKVVFNGTVDVSNPGNNSASLIVRARQIEVRGTLKARSDANKRGGAIRLTATENILVTGTIDVSGNSAGLIRLQAGGPVTLTGLLRGRGLESANPNSASGGAIDIVAGGAFTHQGTLELNSGSAGTGASVTVSAGTNVTIAEIIDVTGGAGDGGDVDIIAGDDIAIQRSIDSSSFSGGGAGDIRVKAGVDRLGGGKMGGTLTVTADLRADGDSDIDGGYDGGEINLGAFGPVAITGNLRSVGANPDGGGGSVIIDSSDSLLNRVTPDLDGDLFIDSTIDVRGPQTIMLDTSGSGGDVDLFVGRDGTVRGSLDLSGGDGAGTLNVFGGRTVTFDAPVDARGTANFAGGGSVTMRAGLGTRGGLNVLRNVDTSARQNGLNGDITLVGCDLALAPNLSVDVSNATANARPRMDLVAPGTMTIGSGGNYRAEPAGTISLLHPPGVVPQIGANVTFVPGAVHVDNRPQLYPPCAVCGDGIRQLGEACDTSAAADGACCNASCTAFVCPTVTPTPTITPTSTGPTRTATPSRTPTPTLSATPTFTIEPTGPTGTPTATPTPTPITLATASPILPAIQPKTLLDCERTIGKATATLVDASLRTLTACGLDAFACVQTKPDGAKRGGCLEAKGAQCKARITKLSKAQDKFSNAVGKECGGHPPVVAGELMRSPEVLGFARLEPLCGGLDLADPDNIATCIRFVSPCEAQNALGFAIPSIGDLFTRIGVEIDNQTACLPPPTGIAADPPIPGIGSTTARCQRQIANAGRKLLKRQLATARDCVDTQIKCRLSGKPRETCNGLAARCARNLSLLDHPSTGARAKMLASVINTCDRLPVDALLGATGIHFRSAEERCTALGLEPPVDAASAAACVTRAFTCTGSAILRQSMPFIDTELARVGLSLGNDAFCALPTPTPTPTEVPTTTATVTPTLNPTPTTSPTPVVTQTVPPISTATPTATFTPAETSTAPTLTPTPTETATPGETTTPGEPTTPAPTSTPGCPNGAVEFGEQCDFGDDLPGDGCDPLCSFEGLIPGGGDGDADCIAEWAVINPFNFPPLDLDGLPSFKQTCVDGDPSCDFDGDPLQNDQCLFQVALCLQNADPNLPSCIAPPGIAKYVLVSPRPNSAEPVDRENATKLVRAFGRLSAVVPSANSDNTLVFDPPLVVAAPDNCTEPVAILVERRGLSERSEKFRINTYSVPPIGGTRIVEDSDTLLLTCLDAPEATPTATSTPTP